jgi:hypothetical protein
MHSISTIQFNSLGHALEKAQEWHQQRIVGDPADEAETGSTLDNSSSQEIGEAYPDENDDQSVDDFMKVCTPDEGEEHDDTSKHLYKCGLHLAKAKMAHMAGDHEQVGRSINSAMASYSKLHAGLKAATQD